MKTICRKLFALRRQSTQKPEASRPVYSSRIRTSNDINDSSSRVSSSSEAAKKIAKMAAMREQTAISKQYVVVMKTTAKSRKTALKDFGSIVGSGPKKTTSVVKAIKPKTFDVKPKITGNERKKRRPNCPQVHGTDSRYSWCIGCQERRSCVRYSDPAPRFPRIWFFLFLQLNLWLFLHKMLQCQDLHWSVSSFYRSTEADFEHLTSSFICFSVIIAIIWSPGCFL